MIASTASGDRDAFAMLYEATSSKLHAICVSVLKDRPEAEETLQEIYIRIWREADRYGASDLSPMTWLITIARNRAVDRLRARKSRTATSPSDEAASLPLTGLGAEPGVATTRVQERRLPDDCRAEIGNDRAEAVRAVYMEGLTYADLASRHDMPIGSVRDWLRRSLVRLGDCVSQ
ncbi:RNA polymerase subunit sigma [Paracoccus methylarcula]|uniref:RNA polymerase subunit sigma n=2 Tax=Paracoccus methylarcula TaxID=72022 RepID=A0A3R7LKW3_9RHOB|nr:RNA polymerase subunit sigma [Paracoccus methylarcula]